VSVPGEEQKAFRFQVEPSDGHPVVIKSPIGKKIIDCLASTFIGTGDHISLGFVEYQ
jgi:hypothetical protein